MEQEVQVKAVEEKQEVSTQEKEAAVLETAVKEGEVNPEYGLQDDGVYKINLDKPPTKKENAVQEQSTNEVSVRDGSESGKEIQKENKEKVEEPAGENKQEKENKSNEEKPGEEIDSPLELVTNENDTVNEARVDSSTKSPEPVQEQKEILPEAETPKLPENVNKLIEFMEETGGTLEDYVNLNKDFSKMDNLSLLNEYYKSTKPHLDSEDINFLMNKNFAYNEENDEPSDIKAKKLAFKEELYNAQQHFNKSKEKYYADLKLRKQNGVPEEYKEAVEYYEEQTQLLEKQQKLSKDFKQKTENVFNTEFKGFDFQVGENKYRFKVENPLKVKEFQNDISNFVQNYLDKDGNITDAKGYHKAIFAGRNADKIANHFYEQGRADAIKESAKAAKNIDMTPRADNSQIVTPSGQKIKVVSGNSSDKLRIKWNK